MRSSILRFLRAIGAGLLSGGLTAAISSSDALKGVIVDIVAAIPVLTVESETTVTFIIFTALTAGLLALDKELRDRGWYGTSK